MDKEKEEDWKTNPKMFTTRLSQSLHRRLKKASFETEKSMTAIINIAVDKYLRERETIKSK